MLSHLLLARPDQEDDEDGEHDGAQAQDDEREVGDHVGDGQQLLHSCRGGIINHHALSRGNRKNLKPRAFVRDWVVGGFSVRHQDNSYDFNI